MRSCGRVFCPRAARASRMCAASISEWSSRPADGEPRPLVKLTMADGAAFPLIN